MNVFKLLNVLKDISIEDKAFNTKEKLDQLHSFITQNNIEESDKKKNEIYSFLENSVTNNYTESNLEIIRILKGENFLGKSSKNYIENIFSSENYKLLSRLAEYSKDRENFINKVNALIAGLENFGFEPHFSNKEYEIGLLLPEEFNNLEKSYKALETWDKFLKVISEIAGEERSNEISILSNGTLEFFILKTGIIASALDLILNKLADLYLKLQKIQKNKKELKFLDNKNIEKELQNAEKEIYNKFLEDVLNKVLLIYKGEAGRGNELKIELENNLKKVLRLTEAGAKIEIITPEIEEPEQPDSEEAKTPEFEKIKEEYNYKIKEKQKIQSTNVELVKLKVNPNQHLLSQSLSIDDMEE